MKNRSDARPATRAIRSTTAAELEREFYGTAEDFERELKNTTITNRPRQEKGRTKARK